MRSCKTCINTELKMCRHLFVLQMQFISCSIFWFLIDNATLHFILVHHKSTLFKLDTKTALSTLDSSAIMLTVQQVLFLWNAAAEPAKRNCILFCLVAKWVKTYWQVLFTPLWNKGTLITKVFLNLNAVKCSYCVLCTFFEGITCRHVDHAQ